MKHKLSIVILIAALATAFSVQAQEGSILTQKIKWVSASSIILSSNVEVNKPCEVLTDASENKITMDQSGRLSEFTIIQHDGVWNDIAENGSIAFSVTFDGQPGSITVEKNGAGIFITLDMSQNPSGVKRKIIVDQIITE